MNNNDKIFDPITTFSLNELLMQAGDLPHDELNRQCIVSSKHSSITSLCYPLRIDAFTIGIGYEGKASVRFNLRDFQVQKDTLFFFSPRSILESPQDNNFRAHVILISTEFMRELNIDLKSMMPQFLLFGKTPFAQLAPKDSEELHRLFSQIESELQHPQTPYSRKVIGHLITALFYKIAGIIQENMQVQPDHGYISHDRADTYFQQFMQELSEHYRQERSVSYYANQLCITPKYLTTLIKRISGKSVSEWIDQFVIFEAKALLKHSHMSIQEISYHLNFPNQSFFGSYFKRNTGMSPSQYKAQQ